MSTRSTSTQSRVVEKPKKQATQSQRVKSTEAKAKAQQALERRTNAQAARTAAALDRLARARVRNPNAFRATQQRTRQNGAVEKRLATVLPSLKGLSRENRVMVDPVSGQVVIHKVGGAHSVTLQHRPSAQFPEGERAAARGMIDIHNHPTGVGNWPTFSDADYQEYSSRTRPPTALVVTERGVAELRPKTGTKWPGYAGTVKPALDRHFQAIDRALVAQARRGGAMARQIANMTEGDLMHLAWRQAARETGLRYSRTTQASSGRRRRARRNG